MLAVLSTIVCLFEYEVYHLRFGQVLALTWSGSPPTGDKEGKSARAVANFGPTAYLWIYRGYCGVSKIFTGATCGKSSPVTTSTGTGWRKSSFSHFACSSVYQYSIKCVPQVRLLLECRCRLCRLGGTDKIFSSFFISEVV